jgi:hypothetical protein
MSANVQREAIPAIPELALHLDSIDLDHSIVRLVSSRKGQLPSLPKHLKLFLGFGDLFSEVRDRNGKRRVRCFRSGQSVPGLHI